MPSIDVSGGGAALAHAPTRRALRSARLLHYGRHFSPHLAAGVVILAVAAATGWWPLCVLLIPVSAYFVPLTWYRCCRYARSDTRRAQLILRHYAWRRCLMEPPAPDAVQGRGSRRPDNWQGTFVRLTDPYDTGCGRLHGIPGPGWERPVRGLRDPRVIDVLLDEGSATETWFAGDLRFGGVVSPVGGGSPVLLRARGRRGLRGEGRAAPPEQDALAIRAGLLDYRDLPKRHPIRRQREDEEALALMRGNRPSRRPGRAP
ncbi:hypothetical protein [Streptomyces spongiae]|uniref:Uncharacterized protein n=1 Tax=Streptomyces spongiae TaxID=565072 RepID=A0A5N8XP95_9ACTN|nr:hypothetical protein [Streptomyces spongiae]MPY61147.1 hypothetical protein [Streptomyces spongiae]